MIEFIRVELINDLDKFVITIGRNNNTERRYTKISKYSKERILRYFLGKIK